MLHVALPLIIGGFLYVFRGGGGDNWFVYSLPDGLWLYSLISALNLIWRNDQSGRLWISAAVILSLTSEVFQYLHYIPGTFDMGDLIAYALGSLVVFLIHSPRLKPLYI